MLKMVSHLKKVLQDLPAEAEELRPLLALATQVRESPHPQPSPEHSRVLKYKILSAVREQAHSRESRPRSKPFKWIFATGLAGATFLCIFAVIALVGVGLWSRGSNSSQTATLADVYGQVEVASSLGNWQTAGNGDKVKSGQQIRVGAESNATLVFFEGSRTTIGPDSELVLDLVDGSRSRGLQVEINQKQVKPASGSSDGNSSTLSSIQFRWRCSVRGLPSM
jgi:hypothetical protein